MKRILLVEDEISLVHFIQKGLEEQGFEVSVALDGNVGYKMASEMAFDIIVLDIMLPGMNGLEVCKKLRTEHVTTPILFLTALSTSENIATGLDLGADDYLAKPFKFIELNARIKALLRRFDITSDTAAADDNEVYTIADLRVDDKAKTVHRGGTEIKLTANEYRLLVELIKNKGRVLSRNTLLESAWDVNYNAGTNVIDVYINYLRNKIETDPSNKLIHTVVGMGYVLKEA